MTRMSTNGDTSSTDVFSFQAFENTMGLKDQNLKHLCANCRQYGLVKNLTLITLRRTRLVFNIQYSTTHECDFFSFVEVRIWQCISNKINYISLYKNVYITSCDDHQCMFFSSPYNTSTRSSSPTPIINVCHCNSLFGKHKNMLFRATILRTRSQ